MEGNANSLDTRRIGFHYFPDTAHFRESDLRAWAPELQALGASWLVLKTPLDRAIPEPFISGLFENGIEPILHFQALPTNPPAEEEMALLFKLYAAWGVRYAVIFDRPNRRRTWSERDWAQTDLVERFIDSFLPLGETAIESGLRPVFPPLEPGGDYWDTAFLRSALQAIQRRGSHDLQRRLSISAYAWPDNLPLN
ncbi:MAG: hypothetical protein R3335_08650, partial [Anaerolineales bacterium]|nr:hypothetical protein [Anaerolineales bacterium]